MQTDSLFYRLFQTAPALLFELMGEANPQAASYVFRSLELKQTAFRIDGVFLPEPMSADAPVYFVEVQFQRDEQIYGRLFNEVMTFLRQNPTVQQWRVVVIYGDRACEPKAAGAHTSLVRLPQVQRLYLNELAEMPSESLELGLVRLIVEPEESAIARAQQLVAQVRESPSRLSTSAIMEMIETIVVYKFPQLSWQEISTMFGISELKQTRVYQQGLEEGLEQGQKNEARSLILRQLSRRVGKLPDGVRSQLEQLSVDALEELGEALLDFAGLADLQGWLRAYGQQGES